MMSGEKKAPEGDPSFSLTLPCTPTPTDPEERKTSTSDLEGRKLSSISIPSGPSVGSVGSNGPSTSFDTTGKATIKAQLGEEIRRMPIHNEELTYDELLLMMQRIFKGSLKSDDDVLVKYKDEDGDLVTISDTADLTLALQANAVLNVKLLLKDKENASRKVADVPVHVIRSELKCVRDKVNKILDYLDENESDTVMPHAATISTLNIGAGAQSVERDQRQASTVNMNGIGSTEEISVAVASVAPVAPIAPDAEAPSRDFDIIFQQKQSGAEMDSSQSALVINAGASSRNIQLSEQRPPQQMSPAKPGIEHGIGATPSQPLPLAHQQNRYPITGPTSQSVPTMMGSSVAGSSGVNQQQQQQPAAHSGPYQSGNAPFQQYPYHASPSPAQNYINTGTSVQYPTTSQPSRPTGAVTSYPTGGPDGAPPGYLQMPPVSSTMPMMNAHNPSAAVPNAVPPMPQQYAPSPQQYNAGMPPAMPAYRPQGPPPPSAAGMGSSNPYSRSAGPPPPVQTYRPQM